MEQTNLSLGFFRILTIRLLKLRTIRSPTTNCFACSEDKKTARWVLLQCYIEVGSGVTGKNNGAIVNILYRKNGCSFSFILRRRKRLFW